VQIGADFSARGTLRSPVFTATIKNFMPIVKLLLLAGADIDPGGMEDGTLLHMAVLSGNLELLRLSLGQGIPINGTNAAGETALHLAVKHHRAEMASELLRRGADPNLKASDGLTARLAAL
jgi:ankyrin repeat protein